MFVQKYATFVIVIIIILKAVCSNQIKSKAYFLKRNVGEL